MKTWLHRFLLALVLLTAFMQPHVNAPAHGPVTIAFATEAEANSCVWVAGTNNWGSAASWTTCGSVAPTSADTCTIAGVGTLTVESAVAGTDVCGTTDFTGFTGTLTHATSKELDIYGALTLVSGMTYTPNGTAILAFKATSGSNNIAFGGKTIPNTTFDGVGGTWVFQDAPATATNTITLTNGSLNTNGVAVNGYKFSSNNANTRALTLGATTWTVGASGTSATWDITIPTGMTLSAASSTIVLPQASTTNSFIGGGLTYGTITSTALTTSAITVGSFTAANLTLSEAAAATGNYKISGNITVTGTFTFNSNTLLNRVYITSDTKGTARIITAAAISSNGGDLQDITGAGAATWDLSASTFGGGDCGGNSGITFNAPKNAFMKTAVSVSWSATGNWKTTDGGSTEITPDYPLPQDTAKFTANSVTAGSKTITIDASAVRLPAMNWTGVLNTPALAFTAAASYFGSITLVSGMTVSGTGAMTFEGRGSQNITTAGLTITPGITLIAPSGTWTQQDNLIANRASSSHAFTKGTWDTGSHNLTFSGSATTITVNGATLKSSGTISTTGTSGTGVNLTSGDINAPLGTWSGTVAGTAPTFSGGTLEIGTLTLTNNAITIAGTAVQIGTGGASFATPLTISSGSLAPTTGNKITSVSSTAIAVSAASSGGGSCTFGDAGSWLDRLPANDNYGFQYRRAM